MKQGCSIRRKKERGVALLIAIFVLLLISVVAIALLVSSGTESALGANYRSSSIVYYAALAGLEETRGRLLPKNGDYFAQSALSPGNAVPLPVGQTFYLINHANSTENIQPWDQSNVYYDHEYKTEFNQEASAATWQSIASIWDNYTQSIPGPVFKWARINAATEVSLNKDVNNDSYFDATTPLFFDPAHVDANGNPWPSLVVSTTPPSTALQAFEITALAALPNGSKKMLQYLVAPIAWRLTFPAALTLDGNSDSFVGPNHNVFHIAGDQDSGDPACIAPTTPNPVPAIGVIQSSDVGSVISGIPASKRSNYTGSTSSPSVAQVTLPSNMQTPQSLDTIVQSITQNADAVIVGPTNQSQLPSAMSNGNPMTVVVAGDPTQPHQGDFTLTGGFTGYGLLVVTGNFTYTSDSSWYGIILVVGQGTVTANSSLTGGGFTGSMLVAKTRDASGNLLTTLGPASFSNLGRGAGVSYNCGWISQAEAPLTYKVLSFREIPQ